MKNKKTNKVYYEKEKYVLCTCNPTNDLIVIEKAEIIRINKLSKQFQGIKPPSEIR